MMKFKLTSSQLNFHTKNLTLDSLLWNQGVVEIFPEVYSYEQLNKAYNRLIEENDSLRVKLAETDSSTVTYVEDFQYVEFPFRQFETEEEMMCAAEQFLNTSIDVYNRLVNCTIFQTKNSSGVMINAHHIVVDGYSVFVMAEQINQYLKNSDYTPSSQQSYVEYLEKEENHRKSKRFERDRKFWSEQFADAPVCDFVSGGKTSMDFSCEHANIEIPSELFEEISIFCEKYDITPSTFFNTVYAIYISKKYDQNHFSIGVPVLNRTTQGEMNMVGLYMHIVPLIVKLQNESFVANAQRIQDSVMSLFRHQKFTQQDIKELLKEENRPAGILFEIVSDYLELPHNDDYEIRIPYSNTLSVPMEMHLQNINNDEYLLKVRYRTAFFNKEEVSSMLEAIMKLAKEALKNPDEDVFKLEMIPDEEKYRLLHTFNDTAADYPRAKSVHVLFEAQVLENYAKTAVTACDKTLTYKELDNKSNRIANALISKGICKGDIVAFVLPRRSSLLSVMLGILKAGAAYLPIDPDYPQDRIEYMLSDSNAKYCITEENIAEMLNNNDCGNPCVQVCGEDICYCIYTSGSTGKPKGTLITHRNVVNYISKNKNNVVDRIITKDCRSIVSVTTVGFDIFVTESLLPLANGMQIVLADEEQAKLSVRLNELLGQNPADVLQTTPTKMKALISDRKNTAYLKKLKAVILGGEALEGAFVKELRKLTDAEIFNIYGPTEATVWVTADKIEDSEDITIGSPFANTQIHIVDKNMKLVPVGVTGELCIAGDCVGAGYLNRPELTAEKFVDNPFGNGKLYKTGDLAYWREDGNIVYVGRNDFQVKIRGQRIELGEIENAVLSVDGIDIAVAVVRKDSTDRQLICVFYTGEKKSVSEIKAVIGKRLPKYMLPHIFTHIEEMPLTSSEKINRNALPDIDLENIETQSEYIAPETEQEKILAECIGEILLTENVSMLDNFFDIGGDSLKAIELTARLEEKAYEVSVKNIFTANDIRELASLLIEKESEKTEIQYESILPATAAQMRIYTAQMMKPDSSLYNIVYAFKSENIDAVRLEEAVNKLIERHESLRTHFENQNGQIMQVIDDTAKVSLEKLESEDIALFSKAFDLTKSPLVHIGYADNTIMLELHHIIADGESMPVIFRELNELYMGRNLSNIPVQYGEFAVVQTDIVASEKYWTDVFSEIPEPLNLPVDFPRKEVQSFNGKEYFECVNIKLHNRIKEKCKKLGITEFVFYNTCFNIMLSGYTNSDDITVGMPISGRTGCFLDSVGMFANTVALRSSVTGEKRVVDLMEEIRDSSVQAIENQNYPFGELVKKLGIEVGGRNPLYDVMFAYQSKEMTDIVFADRKAELIPMPLTSSKYDFTFTVLPRAEDVVVMVEYCMDLYTEKKIQKLLSSFVLLLEKCLDEQTFIRDISVINEEEKNMLLHSFNDTYHSYDIPESSTLYSLFEKTAKANPEKVCLTTAEGELTFGELLAIAECLDNEIQKITKGEKCVIPVIAQRSPEMYAAIYGIIRGGNAYLPIADDYPQDRIDYILENSKAPIAVTQGKYVSLVKNIPCIDMTQFVSDYEKTDCIFPSAAKEDDTAYVIYTSGSTGNPKGAKVSHKSAVNRILWMHEMYPLSENDVILQKTPYTFDVSVWELFWWGMVGGKLAASKPQEHFLPARILDEVYNNKVTHLHFVPSVFELFLNYLEANKDEVQKFSSVRYVFLSGEALSAELITRFYALFDYNRVGLHNLYGPTECAVDVTYYPCKPTDTNPVPIGKPIYNTQIHIVDKYMNLLPVGVRGELCIGGVNVGQGYLNNEALTAEKFVDNPFGEGKLYKTGDLAYFREDGEVIFCGRIDSQIKLNGQRIEISEIEAVISSVSQVESAAVVVNKLRSPEMLVAFYCSAKDITQEIREVCLRKLPGYMVPAAFVRLDKMPLNQSGKLDRKLLSQRKLDFEKQQTDDAPKTITEQIICELFRKALNVDNIGRNSNFFENGGTSLSMISVLSEKIFENITAAQFIQNATPLKLAEILDGEKKVSYKYLEPLYIARDSTETLVLLPFAGGSAEVYAAFTDAVKKQNEKISVYFVRYLHTVNDCEKAAEEIENLMDNTALSIYSHCVGSAVALHILSSLEKKGKTVKHYFAGASIPPSKTVRKNIWNIVPDFVLKKILSSAGAKLDELSADNLKSVLKSFRKDNDFANIAFTDFNGRIKTPVSVIISKTDIFTKNYKKAEQIWKKYAEKINGVHFIDSDSHYFQAAYSYELVNILLKIFE